MKQLKQYIVCFLAVVVLLPAFSLPASAAPAAQVKSNLQLSVDYMLTAVPVPAVSSIGGEWAVIGLARSGCEVPQAYWDGYYQQVEKTLRDCSGILHQHKYTEYSRLVLALTAIGADPSNVAGYNLLAPLGDFEKVIWQGINGPIYALLALDCGGYELPSNATATRQRYVDAILAAQLPEGGWSLTDAADPDLTGMALQALSNYKRQPEVNAAIQRALACLSNQQNCDGSFNTAESTAQVLVALCELKLEWDDPRLTKNGKTLLDGLLSFQRSDGGFVHTHSLTGNAQMASEQGLYALAAAIRAMDHRCSIYDMEDVSIRVLGSSVNGMPGKHPDVNPAKRTAPGKTFSDIAGHAAQSAIEALAERGITQGNENGLFLPDASLSRAEFTTFIVRTLGLTPNRTNLFEDVPEGAWYAAFVGTADRYGIVSGVGENKFAPNGIITRQQAAVMVAKAAGLCGLETEMTDAGQLDTLCLFDDYTAVAGWARAGVAFCYASGIWDDSEWEIRPSQAVTRAEMAQMLCRLLDVSGLLEK